MWPGSERAMNHFSLFAGIGGIDLAAEWAGFHSAGQCEIDEYCNKVLQKHWPDVPKWSDIVELTGEEIKQKCGSISLLSGGFPCQPFSAAGKRKGEKDERYIWPEFLRIVREVEPRWILAENVRGLLSINSGRTFRRILGDLAEAGYGVGWLCYGASDVGAPHRRERIFIVGYSRSCGLSGEPRGRSGQELENRHSQHQAGHMANAPQQLLNGCQQAGQTGRGENADILHTQQQGEPSRVGRERKRNQRDRGGQRPSQPRMGGVPDGFPAGMDGGLNWPTPTSRDHKDGTAESCKNVPVNCLLGRAVHQWPAGPGEQREWEPPRVATGKKDRVSRLKCLGNAVVPQQVYPILKAIAKAEAKHD